MKVFIVFFETGSYDDHSYTLQGVFTTRSLAELYIEKEKEKNAYLSSLTEKYQEALRKWNEENPYVEPPEPHLYELIRSMRGKLCDKCKILKNDLCMQCLSKEDRKKAVDQHSMNKSVWRQTWQNNSQQHARDQKVWTQEFLKPHEEELKKFGIIDPSSGITLSSYWYPSAFLYEEEYDKFEIEEHEVRDV